MRRFIIFAAFMMLLGTASGCDWVQDRVPDDYFYRNNNGGPAETGSTTEDSEETEGSTTADTQETSGDTGTGSTVGGTGGADNGFEGVPTTPDGGSAPDGGTAGVTFDIPQGWYWRDSEHRTAAIGDPATMPDYYVPAGKIVLWGIATGTDSEAKSAIQAEHAENLAECVKQGANCSGQPFYREINVADTIVYAAVDQPEYAEMRTTLGKFAKNGKVVTFTIYDDIDNQMTLLDKVITTIDW